MGPTSHRWDDLRLRLRRQVVRCIPIEAYLVVRDVGRMWLRGIYHYDAKEASTGTVAARDDTRPYVRLLGWTAVVLGCLLRLW